MTYKTTSNFKQWQSDISDPNLTN